MSENVAVPLSAATTRYGSSLVVAHDVGRRDDLAVDDVVGDVEQAADERPVAGLDLLGERLAPARPAAA